MGYLKWLIIGAIVGLPILASFAAIPSSAAPEGIGGYINGIIEYWKEVISQINVSADSVNESISSVSNKITNV